MVKEEAQARTTKVASYICKSEYMDKTYGEGMRVFNKMKNEGFWRCCNCKAEKHL
jgi:hypothetical protein